jgi:hypothetical protein
MNTTGKWLARAGSLAIMLGFVLPSLTVSCTAMPGFGQSFSLADLSGQVDQPFLYLIPLGALAALIFSLIPHNNPVLAPYYWLGQVAGIGIGLISIAGSILSLNSQVDRLGAFDLSPEFGLFVLGTGFAFSIAGILVQWRENSGLSPNSKSAPVPNAYIDEQDFFPDNALKPPVSPNLSSAQLEVLQGDLPFSMIPVQTDYFRIGRGSQNDLQLPDQRVSRQHVHLRYAQGTWFLQDQGSSGGTFINGREVAAGRLNSGDQITIGNTTFIFRC